MTLYCEEYFFLLKFRARSARGAARPPSLRAFLFGEGAPFVQPSSPPHSWLLHPTSLLVSFHGDRKPLEAPRVSAPLPPRHLSWLQIPSRGDNIQNFPQAGIIILIRLSVKAETQTLSDLLLAPPAASLQHGHCPPCTLQPSACWATSPPHPFSLFFPSLSLVVQFFFS